MAWPKWCGAHGHRGPELTMEGPYNELALVSKECGLKDHRCYVTRNQLCVNSSSTR